MLQHLSIKNYALIDELELSLPEGFTAITGETGAGKSIILGALGLILGQRADLQALRDPERKCIIEGQFTIKPVYQAFFEAHDLDFDRQSLIRREITPSGKSRAFINDTPVNLKILQALAAHLIDIHSQHQTILLNDRNFQLSLLDDFAGNKAQREDYQESYQQFLRLRKEKERLLALADSEVGDADYLKFLLEELDSAHLKPAEQEDIERELSVIEHSGEITARIGESLQLIDEENNGLQAQLQQVCSALQSISKYDPDLESLTGRFESLRIELDDLRLELADKDQQSEFDPSEQEKLDQRLSQLIALQRKHQVESVEALIEKHKELESRIGEIESLEARRSKIDGDLAEQEEDLRKKAEALSKSRKSVIAELKSAITQILKQVNLARAQFEIEILDGGDFSANGRDEIQFLFSANPGQKGLPLQKVASGGELSRVMLALKAIMARTRSLPTVIFDEIDSGVSGEAAGKIGKILAEMGSLMQVVSITHLPQIASLAAHHYKVSKRSEKGTTFTQLKKLDQNQRIEELARLLSGDRISEAALANAKTLLNLEESR